MRFVRNLISIAIGLVCGGIATFFVASSGRGFFPEYQDVPNITEPLAFASFIETLPVGAFIVLLFAHSTGSLLAAFVATSLSGHTRPTPAIAIGVLMLAGGVRNLMLIPHPVWYQISEAIIYLPAVFVGYILSLKVTQMITSRQSHNL
jgi:zinc transporter ZupT